MQQRVDFMFLDGGNEVADQCVLIRHLQRFRGLGGLPFLGPGGLDLPLRLAAAAACCCLRGFGLLRI